MLLCVDGVLQQIMADAALGPSRWLSLVYNYRMTDTLEKRATKQKKPPGPQVRFSEHIAETICERLSNGESLNKICKSDGMPRMATVFLWIADNDQFRDNYVRAREAQADALFDEIKDIADTPQIGVKTITRSDGTKETVEADMVEHRRLQVDARKWIAAKLLPKRYGDRIEQVHTGQDGGPIEFHSMTEVELRAWLVQQVQLLRLTDLPALEDLSDTDGAIVSKLMAR